MQNPKTGDVLGDKTVQDIGRLSNNLINQISESHADAFDWRSGAFQYCVCSFQLDELKW